MKRLLAFLVLALAPAALAAPTPLVLISLDGFRWDYLDLRPDATPRLRQLRHDGVTARGLIPVFPSNTFPNHYSIVTGLYPSHHGILNNHFFDAKLGEFFHYNRAASVQDSRWWGGEPIWITAAKQGLHSAVSFWVGSEAAIGGLRPDHWRAYDPAMSFEKRFAEFGDWFRAPAESRPAVVCFYFEEANGAGHNHGPDSPELVDALRLLDREVGALVDQLAADHIAANFVIVSDHGMTSCGDDRVVVLDDLIELKTVQLDFDDTAVGLRPIQGDADSVLKKLGDVPHAQAYRVDRLPPRFHITPGPRVPPVWIVPDEGWRFLTLAQTRAPRVNPIVGQHGYDPALASMRGLFIACGPAFKSGVTIEALENIHVYNLLCATLSLKPAPNDGDDRLVRAALR